MRSAYVLDLTRLTSRIGRGVLTGIDRVELAYLRHILSCDKPAFGLVRSPFGFLLLGRTGCMALADLAGGEMPVLPARFGFGPPALGLLRCHAVARQPHFRLRHLMRAVPAGAAYINVGHANLSVGTLADIGRAGIMRAVMIHDTIPLDHPELARAGTQAAFAAKVEATARHADLALHISHDACQKTEAHFAAAGRIPQGVTAHLGVQLARPSSGPLAPSRPYFIALGTIEPRKNLALLFNIWDGLAAQGDAPQLVVIGAKGWADAALFAQMAALAGRGAVIHGENLPDGAVAGLMQGAIALLFPSLAEGFGLPPQEAAALGTPVIAADLPVLRETCGEFPVYLHPQDAYSWQEAIVRLARHWPSGQERRAKVGLPNWADHFNKVFTQIG